MPAASTMTFWRGNRADAGFTRAIPEVAAEFWASVHGRSFAHDSATGVFRRLDPALRHFRTSPDGPIPSGRTRPLTAACR